MKFIKYIFLFISASSVCSLYSFGQNVTNTNKIPIIVITDCYHPYQDPGDDMDLITGFALDNVDLKGIILDITNAFRKDTADHLTLWKDPRGPREVGIIPVMQLNYIFNRNIPFAVGPMKLMASETDKMYNLPDFQQNGVQLLIDILRKSKIPVEILSFGSGRVLAVAYNREPDLIRAKVNLIHLSGGTASTNYELGTDKGANSISGGEWNVALDVFAFTRLLRSDLPIAIYPCAGKDGGFVKDVNNTYWTIKDMSFSKEIDRKLQRYLDFAFNKKAQHDFLKAMDIGPLFSDGTAKYIEPFHVWETAIWLKATQREVVKTTKGDFVILRRNQITANHEVIENSLIPCSLVVRQDGRFEFAYTKEPSNFSIYYRANTDLNEKALQSALPELFKTYKP